MVRLASLLTCALLIVIGPGIPTHGQESPANAPAAAAERLADSPQNGDDQEKNGDEGRRRHHMGLDPETRVLLEEVMVARLSKQLAMDDEETVALVRKFSDFRDETFASRKQRMKIMRQLRSELKDAQDSESIENLLDQMIAEDDKIHEMRKSFFDHIGEDLTPWQRGRLYVFLAEFEMDMRRLIDKARSHHSGRGGDHDRESKRERPGDSAESDKEEASAP